MRNNFCLRFLLFRWLLEVWSIEVDFFIDTMRLLTKGDFFVLVEYSVLLLVQTIAIIMWCWVETPFL